MKEETKNKISYYTSRTQQHFNEVNNLFWNQADNMSVICVLTLLEGPIYISLGAFYDLASLPYRLVHEKEAVKTR